ncbi:hypothetical protein PGC35_09080, partial [Psychrobacillus sp. PGGUH221]|uniref:hypothetical protein n=1 Tax=Psychrobacillus sp. PGGUH221 TaxID=3020058 RepID=UPI0035C69589
MKPAFFTYEAEIKNVLLRKLVAEIQEILLLRGARRRTSKDFAPARSSSQNFKRFCSCAELVAELQKILLLRGARRRKSRSFAPAQARRRKSRSFAPAQARRRKSRSFAP